MTTLDSLGITECEKEWVKTNQDFFKRVNFQSEYGYLMGAIKSTPSLALNVAETVCSGNQ